MTAGRTALILGGLLLCGGAPALPRDPTAPAPSDRGRYLALHVSLCLFCHSEIDWKAEGFPPRADAAGAGRAQFSESTPWLAVPNLTPDRDTGAGGWTDEQLDRAIRQGIGSDGRVLHPAMPSASYHALTDHDAAAVIEYLRSLRPVRNPIPPSRVPDDVRSRLRPLPKPTSTPLKRGEYLVAVATCGRCHTPVDAAGAPIPGMAFAGGVRLKGPWGDLHSPNLTPDASGIECLDEKDFVHAMKTGELPGHTLNAVMPWGYYRGMTDEDLRAVFAHLKALRPVRHFVDNSVAPTPCPKCGAAHGLGNKNRE